MILVLPVKDTVGREPLLNILTFLNQKQETTVICRQRKFQNQHWLINITDLLNAVIDSLQPQC